MKMLPFYAFYCYTPLIQTSLLLITDAMKDDIPPPTPSASSASSSDVKTVVGYIQDDEMREQGDAGDLSLPKRPWRRTPTDWRSIITHEYKGAGTREDPFVVVWLPQDGENPYRWKPLYKWTLTILGESKVVVGE